MADWPTIPSGFGYPLVDMESKRLPDPTMEAIQADTAAAIVDPETPVGDALSATFAPSLSEQDSRIAALASQAANSAAKYLYTEIVDEDYPGTGAITSWGGTAEGHIRPPASLAFLLATLLSKERYDAATVGRSESDARVQAVRFIVSLATTHRANGGAWGGMEDTAPTQGSGWQEALWANLFCSAGWLLRDDLSSGELEDVKNVAVWEANRMLMANWTIPFWKDADGVEVTAGDSKADEIAWDAGVLLSALALDPSNENANEWYIVLVRAGIAHNAIPADLTDDAEVNGVVPSAFLTGTNMNSDGTIVNHDRIHPNYMVAGTHGLYGFFAVAAEAGVAVPRAAKRHADLIYRALTTREFEPGTMDYMRGGNTQAPGGTIYPWPAGDGAIYFPQGTDYGWERIASFVPFNVCAHKYGWDRGLTPASFWAVLHLERQVSNQARFDTGQSFGPGEGGSVASEAIVGANMAFALLTILAPDLTFSSDVAMVVSSWPEAITYLEPRMWLKLDDTAGPTVVDSSGNGHDGYVVGTDPTWGQTSLIPSDPSGDSVTAAGDRIILVDAVDWVDGTLSFACVYQRSGIPGTSEIPFGRLSTGTGDNTGGRAWCFQIDSGTGYAKLQVYSDADVLLPSVGPTSFSVCDGEPHLLSATINELGARFFVDGVYIARRTDAALQLDTNARVHVLARRSSGTTIASGINGSFLDDCVIFQNPLSDVMHAALWTAFNA